MTNVERIWLLVLWPLKCIKSGNQNSRCIYVGTSTRTWMLAQAHTYMAFITLFHPTRLFRAKFIVYTCWNMSKLNLCNVLSLARYWTCLLLTDFETILFLTRENHKYKNSVCGGKLKRCKALFSPIARGAHKTLLIAKCALIPIKRFLSSQNVSFLWGAQHALQFY